MQDSISWDPTNFKNSSLHGVGFPLLVSITTLPHLLSELGSVIVPKPASDDDDSSSRILGLILVTDILLILC